FSSRRRHTRFSRDWSSDVCSSDLLGDGPGKVTSPSTFAQGQKIGGLSRTSCPSRLSEDRLLQAGGGPRFALFQAGANRINGISRSEERRVGKECEFECGRAQ